LKTTFEMSSIFYDLLYKEKNYESEANYIINKINKYTSETNTLLDLGCGTGKHCEIFANKGLKVTGIDISKEMLSRAVEHENINYICSDINKYSTSDKQDIAVAMFHVVSYLSRENELQEFLKQTNRNLKMEGLLIFDVWNKEGVEYLKPETRYLSLENDKYDFVRCAVPNWEKNKNIVKVNYHFFYRDKNEKLWADFKEIHEMKYFSTVYVIEMAKKTGFEIIEVENMYDPKNLDTKVWALTYVLRKTEDA